MNNAIDWENIRKNNLFRKWQIELNMINSRDENPEPLKASEYITHISRDDYKELLKYALRGMFEDLEDPLSKAKRFKREMENDNN